LEIYLGEVEEVGVEVEVKKLREVVGVELEFYLHHLILMPQL